MKTGVLIHGYNVNSSNWQNVVWWEDTKLIGRLPQGAKAVSLMNPELIVFGMGASVKDGKIEAEIMRDYLLEYFHELAVLPEFLGKGALSATTPLSCYTSIYICDQFLPHQ